MKRQILAMLMASVMVITMIPATAFAEVFEPATDAQAGTAEVQSDCTTSTAVFAESEYSVQEGKSIYIRYDGVTYAEVDSCKMEDTAIATISYNRYSSQVTITGKKRGTTTLTVTTTYGTAETYTINVTPGDFFIEDTPYSYSMERGETDYVAVSSGYNEYTWTVDDESVIRLEDTYVGYKKKVIAVGKGEAMISITNEYGDFTSVILTVTADEFTVEGSTNPTIVIRSGGIQYLDLPYSSDYNWDECTFEIADESIITAELTDKYYSSGSSCYVSALKPGDTTMTVYSKYGETVVCNIHVYEALDDLYFTEDEYVVWLGQTFQLPYVAEPVDSNNKLTFTVSSWYDDIVSISEDGVVTPLKEGVAYGVEVESECYSYDECDIIVKAPYFTKESYVLYKNQTEQIELMGGREDTVWASSDESIATVSATGEVTALRAGSVVISANTGGYEIATFVDVINPTISKKTASIWAGKTLQLKITGGVGSVEWTTSNKNIATVSNTGKVTAKKAGTVTISANVSGVTLKCKVTVKGPQLSVAKKTLIAKQTFKLTVNGATSKVKWSSGNTKVATVNANGKVTAKKAGTATIKAKVNGKTLNCKITVKANQITYYPTTDVNQYTYGEPSIALKKAYYDGNNLKVDIYVFNNRIFKANKFDWLIYKVYDNNGKVIATKKFTNVKLNIKPGGYKKITLTFSGNAVKQKNAILNYGVSDYWSYWYTYTY